MYLFYYTYLNFGGIEFFDFKNGDIEQPNPTMHLTMPMDSYVNI